MAFKKMITAVDTHAGEPMRVITGGVTHIPGSSVFEKMKWLETEGDDLRMMMLREPRGYPPVCCNLIVPPSNPDADAGFIISEQFDGLELVVENGRKITSIASRLRAAAAEQLPVVHPENPEFKNVTISQISGP